MLPREHGATIILLGSLAAGLIVSPSAPSSTALAMCLAVLGLFLLRVPVLRLVRRGRPLARAARRRAVGWTVLYGGVTIVAVVCVVLALPVIDLLVLAVAAVPFGAVAFGAGMRRDERSLWAEILAIAAICLAAPAAVLSVMGGLNTSAWQVYVTCALFFGGGFFHIRGLLRRRQQRASKPGFFDPSWWSLTSVVVALGLGLAGVLPSVLAASVVPGALRPALFRGAILERPQRVGLTETALTIGFLALLLLSS